MTASVNIAIKGDTSDAQRAMATLQGRISKVEAEARHASSAMNAMGSGVSKLAAGGAAFLSLEMAKKIFEISDAALRSASTMEGLSLAARNNAEAYVAAADEAKAQLTALMAEVSGPMMTELATAATEAVGFWKKIFGIGIEGEEGAAIDAANNLNNLNAELKTHETIMRKTAERREDLNRRGKSTANIDGLINAQLSKQQLLLGKVAAAQEDLKQKGETVANSRAVNAQVAADKAAAEAKRKQAEADRKAKEAAAARKAKDAKDAADAYRESGFWEVSDAWKADEKVRADIKATKVPDGEEVTAEQDAERLKRVQGYQAETAAYLAEIDARTAAKKREADINRQMLEDEARIMESNRVFRLRAFQAQGQAAATFFNGVSALAARGDMQDRKRRMAWKSAAIAEATAATAVGFAKALEQQGPLGIITGLGVLAAGAAQIDTIRAQKFARGGIVRGPETGDRVPIQANGGELVLTKAQQARLFAMANGAGGSSQTITYAPVYQYKASEVDKRRDYRAFASEMRSASMDPTFNRRQAAL